MNNQSIQENVGTEMKEMTTSEKDRILQNFETFKSYLGDQVQKGEKIGLSEEMIAKGAQKVGTYLAASEEPRNSEEKLLQEMWKVSEDEQRHTLSHVLVNLAKTTN